jgi:hypothetical protein
MEATDSIKVYVRKGVEKSERLITFVPPAEFSQLELIDDGWAIDGNQALQTVPINRLKHTESKLVEWFRQKGYTTFFC